MCKHTETYGRGAIGEGRVIKILNKLNKGRYRLFNNIKIEYNDKQVEIDHLIVSRFGVYIIETKNISGTVTGMVEDKYWLKSKAKTKKFYNPIVQNEIHIKAFKQKIEAYIDEEIPIYSIVVFITNGKVNTDATNVINEKELISMIYKLNKETITDDMCSKIIEIF